MQIRRLNGGRLTGIKATLKASPERISYSDRDGTRHTSVAYILSLEIGGTDLRTLVATMTEPARLLSEGRPTIDLSKGAQYVVHEPEAERAMEISGEFYPYSDAAADVSAEPSSGQREKDEQLARICDLARRLGFNDAKTKMLIGQSAANLADLQRKLSNELDEKPDNMRRPNGDNSSSMKQLREEKAQKAPPVAAESAKPSRQADSELVHGFLF